MSTHTRRGFLKRAGAAAIAASTIPLSRASGRALGANDAVRVGVIGLHGRGQLHIRMVTQVPGFRLAALCDVDPAILANVAQKAEAKAGKLSRFADLRKLFDAKDIDAVCIATPNHWHSLASLWACQAGMDVYVEKPVSHNVWEGRQLVRAARKYGRMVQTGTQARANPDVIEAVAWLRAGNLGRIQRALGFCWNPRLSIGKVGHGEIPPGLDYDLWTGPARLEPLRRQNLHYDWHWLYNCGSGDLGNQGIHEMDLARWCLGQEELSPRVMSIGGRLGYDDDAETPNSQIVYHDYPGAPLIFEVRGLPKSKQFQADEKAWRHNMDLPELFDTPRGIGVIVVCEGGRLLIAEGGLSLLAVDASGRTVRRFDRPDARKAKGWSKGDYANFSSWQAAIRSRNMSDLAAEILQGHLSSALCHTGMISHRLGRGMPAGEIAAQIASSGVFADRFAPFREYLERNGVDLSRPGLALGPWLAMDPKTERFTDSEAANAMLTRPYRQPYVVPEEV